MADALRPDQVAATVAFSGAPAGTSVAEWVAKARQESSFDPDVTNGSHIGLWQINYKLHAGKAGQSSDPATFRQQLTQPFVNFAVAKALYAESGWKPWAASGGKPSPNAADKLAAQNPSIVPPGVEGSDPLEDVADALSDPFEDVASAIGAGVSTLWDAAGWVSDRKNWGRIVFVAIGGVVIVTALGVIAKPAVTETIRDVRPV